MEYVSLEEGKKFLKQVPGKITVVFEEASNGLKKGIKTIKYINKDLRFPQFISQFQKKLHLKSEDALFFLVKGKNALVGNLTFQEIYNKFKDKDGLLYITYARELVWGN